MSKFIVIRNNVVIEKFDTLASANLLVNTIHTLKSLEGNEYEGTLGRSSKMTVEVPFVGYFDYLNVVEYNKYQDDHILWSVGYQDDAGNYLVPGRIVDRSGNGWLVEWTVIGNCDVGYLTHINNDSWDIGSIVTWFGENQNYPNTEDAVDSILEEDKKFREALPLNEDIQKGHQGSLPKCDA